MCNIVKPFINKVKLLGTTIKKNQIINLVLDSSLNIKVQRIQNVYRLNQQEGYKEHQIN